MWKSPSLNKGVKGWLLSRGSWITNAYMPTMPANRTPRHRRRHFLTKSLIHGGGRVMLAYFQRWNESEIIESKHHMICGHFHKRYLEIPIGSHAGGQIGAAATGLRQSHSNSGIWAASSTHTTAHGNAGSLTHWAGQESNPWPHGSQSDSLTTEPWRELLSAFLFKDTVLNIHCWLTNIKLMSNNTVTHAWMKLP